MAREPPERGNEPADDSEARERIARLYREQGSTLTRRLRARLRSDEEARDMVQEGFARLLGSARLAALRQPEAFLNRILRNLLIDRGRTARARQLPPGVRPEPEPASRADQADGIELRQARERYRAALEALPPRTRQVFLLHRVEELGYREIGERLGISPRTVEWHVAEAIARLARELDLE